MELQATAPARFFLQDEYYAIKVEDQQLVLEGRDSQTYIPFTQWSGATDVARGLVWGSLILYGHPSSDGSREAWKVQGLPWKRTRAFGRIAVKQFERWHQLQCRQLNLYLPKWQQKLQLMQDQPAYLAFSQWNEWQQEVFDDLDEIGMSLEEANLRMPASMEEINLWLSDGASQYQDRNQSWLEKERTNWQVLFATFESAPLNPSQQQAVLLNDDHNLVLAGAGTGKTSVLMARVGYLLQSHQAQAHEIAMLAFGKEAAREMSQRLNNKIGITSKKVTVSTFHKLALQIIEQVEGDKPRIIPLASDEKAKRQWNGQWLKQHWENATNYKRWQKHLGVWPIAYLKGDEELKNQFENPKLLDWLERQVDVLMALNSTKKGIQQRLLNHEEYSRLNSELQLVWPALQAWKQHLKQTGELDFHSMIEKATAYVIKGRFASPWRFLMVDEYQDISPARLALIEALVGQKSQQGRRSLFAVGDDWQSIYQFAGSDVSLTTAFTSRYPNARIHNLDTTYRFNSQICDVASAFITRNREQLPKQISALTQSDETAVSVVQESKMLSVLERLNQQGGKCSVLVLGRTHKNKPKSMTLWRQTYPNLDLSFMTCHASKGKEADVVILMGVEENGFPAKERAPHLDDALKASDESYPHAEERRLFYVALTRAKQEVIVSYDQKPSLFVNELLDGSYEVERG